MRRLVVFSGRVRELKAFLQGFQAGIQALKAA